MITDGEKWHYLVVNNLSRLLRGITSNHHDGFYCLNCFHSYRTKNKLEAYKKICGNHDYCHVEMAIKGNNTIKYNHGEKSIKIPFTIFADLECLLEKMSTCQNDPNKSSTTKINKHTPSGYSIFTNCSFDESKNKISYYREDDCMKKFCKDLREHVTKIINYEKKKMISLTTEEKVHYNKQKVCYICKKEFDNSDKKQQKVRDHCHYTDKYRGAAHNICNLRYKVSKEIPVVKYPKRLHELHSDLPFLSERMEVNKCKKLVCNLFNKKKYVVHINALKQALDHGLKLKKVHRVIEFN